MRHRGDVDASDTGNVGGDLDRARCQQRHHGKAECRRATGGGDGINVLRHFDDTDSHVCVLARIDAHHNDVDSEGRAREHKDYAGGSRLRGCDRSVILCQRS